MGRNMVAWSDVLKAADAGEWVTPDRLQAPGERPTSQARTSQAESPNFLSLLCAQPFFNPNSIFSPILSATRGRFPSLSLAERDVSLRTRPPGRGCPGPLLRLLHGDGRKAAWNLY